jgi:hypothetical protein
LNYLWKQGARQKLSAQVVGEELERIRVEDGGLVTPERVVDEATDPESPLHDGFEWDDRKGAVEYRLVQARQMLRSCVIAPESSMGASVAPTIRAFVVVNANDSKGYTSISAAMSEKETRDQVVQRAMRELRQWRERYRDLAEFAALFEVMDEHAA